MVENVVSDDSDDDVLDLIPPVMPVTILPPAPFIEDEFSDEVSRQALSHEKREQVRLARKPDISGLKDAVHVNKAGELTLRFGVGDRVVVERYCSFLKNEPWLDTRTLKVLEIDLEKNILHCLDEEMMHHTFVGMLPPFYVVKLAPRKLTEKWYAADKGTPVDSMKAAPKGRGRPKGSKNRPKAQVAAERKQKHAARAAKKKKKGSRR